ncbi:MAG: AraC family transcriptional regulator [Eubacteriales bacterium]|nr:AraC family transcriptional regulator [Eubacteriales bacterium]
MEKKTVGTERETDSHGRRILYDIFANTHTDFEDMVRPHTHTYFEIILIEEGVGTDTCGDAPIYAVAGDVVFIAPNAIHNLYHAPEFGRYRSIVVKFSPLFLYPLDATQSDIDCLFTTPYFRLPVTLFRKESPEAIRLGGMIREIHRERAEKRLGYELALRAKLSELYLFLVRLLAHAPEVSAPVAERLTEDSTMKLKAALSYMEESYTYNLSMQEVAEQVGMDYYQFSRFFRRMTNKRFNEYLSELRLSHAKKMLLTDSKTVSEVAMECGFDYLSYFSDKFKKAYGISPQDFRRKYRGKE